MNPCPFLSWFLCGAVFTSSYPQVQQSIDNHTKLDRDLYAAAVKLYDEVGRSARHAPREFCGPFVVCRGQLSGRSLSLPQSSRGDCAEGV